MFFISSVLLYPPSLLQCRRKGSPASRQDKDKIMYIHASPSLSLFFPYHPPSCFLPGLKVDVEKLEQNIPCCKASDALASIILWGGGSGQRVPGGFEGFPFFLSLPVLSTWGATHTKSTHTCTAHLHTQTQLWEHGANSSGTEATKSRGFIVEISTFLSSRRIPLLFSRLAGRQDDQCFSGLPPQEEDGEDGVLDFRQCVFLYWRRGIWADSGRSVV